MNITRRTLLASIAPVAAAGCGSLRGPTAAGRPVTPKAPDSSGFLEAVRNGDLGEVRVRLAHDPALATARDEIGRSAFVIAHLHGRGEVATLLQGTGLELDLVESVFAADWKRVDALARAKPELCREVHPTGGTPLHAAALAGSNSLWRLRSVGCLPDFAPKGGDGFTPARAAMNCRTVTGARIAATELLGNGSSCNAPQQGGDSVLHGAVRRRSQALVRLAIRKHADVAHRDDQGRTALELAHELDWDDGARLLVDHDAIPRDCRESRFELDANRQPIQRPDLSDVPRKLQSAVTAASHNDLPKVRELVESDPRLVFSISTDDELAIEASAHIGQRPLMRFHLDHGAPLSLPTAVSLGDTATVEFLLGRNPDLVHERGAHDFPLMYFVAFGGDEPEIAALLHSHGADVDQESQGTTALHWCVVRGRRELARWLIENGADLEAIGFNFDRKGLTPLELAHARGRDEMAKLLIDAGAGR